MWPFSRKSRTGSSRPAAAGPGGAKAKGCKLDDTLGALGETTARRFLKSQGLSILARNYRCPAGEVDLIALEKPAVRGGAETIVFVEVKTRTSDAFTDPEAAVDSAKCRRIRRVANYYLSTRPTQGYNLRFDILAIVLAEGKPPRIKHIVDAF